MRGKGRKKWMEKEEEKGIKRAGSSMRERKRSKKDRVKGREEGRKDGREMIKRKYGSREILTNEMKNRRKDVRIYWRTGMKN